MDYWIVNIIQNKYRCWDDCLHYKIICAGHNDPPSHTLKQLNIGDQIYVCLDFKGFIANGVVIEKAVLAGNCELEGDFISLDGFSTFSKMHIRDIIFKRTYLTDDSHNSVLGEWIVKVRWTTVLKKKKKFKNIPLSSIAALKLSDKNLIDELNDIFQ